jgi:hypothetical protein
MRSDELGVGMLVTLLCAQDDLAIRTWTVLHQCDYTRHASRVPTRPTAPRIFRLVLHHT